MAGLVTAYLLHQDTRKRYAVKLFESGKTLSLDSASVSIPNSSGTLSDRVDLPMRAFAGGYYNNLRAMYDHLGVRYHSQRFLFEFANGDSANTEPGHTGEDSSYFVYASNLHKTALPRPKAMASVTYLVEAVYLLACYAWFSICCFLVTPQTTNDVSETLAHYLQRIHLPEYFVTYYLLPLISSVSTCPHEALLKFPARDLTEYKRRTHGAPHYTVSNGVKTVQDMLVGGIDYELSTMVSEIELQRSGIKICWKKVNDQGGAASVQEEIFDRVVLAVAPDIVGEIFDPLRRYMTKIPTTIVESVVHTDRKLLSIENPEEGDGHRHPAQIISLRTSTNGAHRTESLHLQPCGAIVTTCPFTAIDPSLIIHSARFTRVLRSPESRRVVNSIFNNTPHYYGDEKSRPIWRNGDNGVWLAGGWCWDGMVLLEGCILSAMRVADAFDVDVPWTRESET
ncbi:uncharacterized protein BDR25DRAFT_260336 [Lindgomyces ingoldianus]|uniref:Uncharacterized protein n=1 Tax=Lindgomyces ingoldianus TaxID=673940 RepID=A0ACB6QXR3_9PLEO|nr:uncharacterized protein BDR25DRAFT_260336 [Lindgomyces ingoldianus]KAF2471793.1 hypothetical protein BDR25DRAFT_260336 [Lindgomyces ingoldianus]